MLLLAKEGEQVERSKAETKHPLYTMNLSRLETRMDPKQQPLLHPLPCRDRPLRTNEARMAFLVHYQSIVNLEPSAE